MQSLRPVRSKSCDPLKILLSLVSIMAIGSLSACSSGGGGSNLEGEETFDCSVSVSDGAPAQLSLVDDSSVSDSGFFSKQLRTQDLRALYQTSILETIKYGQATGVSIYRVTPKSNGCGYFSSLQAAPSAQQKIWDKASESLDENSRLLGVFFHYDQDDEDYEAGKTPTVLINAATDRWTLVHELTHANFNKSRRQTERDYQTDAALKKSLLKNYGDIQKASKKPIEDSATALATASLLRRTYDELVKFLTRYFFEEITIESLLLNAWSAGELKYHASNSPKNGIAYIYASEERAEALFDDLSKAQWRLRTNNAVLENNADMDYVFSAMNSLRADISKKVGEAKLVYETKNQELSLASSLMPQNQLRGYREPVFNDHAIAGLESDMDTSEPNAGGRLGKPGCMHGNSDLVRELLAISGSH